MNQDTLRKGSRSTTCARVGIRRMTILIFASLLAVASCGAAYGAGQVGSMFGSVGCGPLSDDCQASASLYNSSPSFTTDYYGNVDLEVDWTASVSFYYWYEDQFDVDFDWYVDSVLKTSKSVSCSNNCNKSGKLKYTMNSPNGTTTYSVRLDVDVDGEASCSNSATKSISIVRPVCSTTLTLSGIGDKNQNTTSVTINGAVKDDDCGVTFSDNGSITVVVKDPDNNTILNTTVNLVSGSFSTSCTLPSKDETKSYGTYIVTATYDAMSPTGHDRDDTGTADTETFDRKWAVRIPSPPCAADVVVDPSAPSSNWICVSDFEDGNIYVIEFASDVVHEVLGISGLLSGNPQGLAGVSDFVGGGDASLLAFSDDATSQLTFIDLEGNLVHDYAGPTAHPYGLAFDGTDLWVADSETGTLFRCDLNTGTLIETIHPNVGPITGLAWDEEVGRWAGPTLLAVTPGSVYQIQRIDPVSGNVLEVLPINSQKHDAVMAVDGQIAVADFGSRDLYMLYEGEPGAPDDVHVSSVPGGPEATRLIWNDPDAEPEWNQIRIYRDGVILSTLPPDVESYDDSDVVEGTFYEYFLTSYDSTRERESPASHTVGCFAERRPPMTLHVPGEYESIQTAIFAAQSDDQILVQPGTYPGRIDFAGRDVDIISRDGPTTTILDGGGYPFPLVVIDSTEAGPVRLSGFTLTGCQLRHGSGVVQIGADASPVIENNVITGNTVWYNGGGIRCDGGGSGEASLRNNTIAFNTMHPDSVGILTGGGLYLIGGTPLVTHNIVASNDSSSYAIYCDDGATPNLVCNNLWDSFLENYQGCSAGESDFSEDPLFCDPNAGDLRLCLDSSSLDHGACGRVGALGQGCGPCGSSLDWADHDVGNSILTVTNQGILGFMDATQSVGSGFVYPSAGSNLLYLGSLWVGESPDYIANRDYDADPNIEWQVLEDPNGHIWIDNSGYADQAIHAHYDDEGAMTPRGLTVHQESWGFSSPDPARNLILVHYLIRNDGATSLTDVFVGNFLDLDIGEYTTNTGGTDPSRDLAYITDLSGIHAGVRLLRDANDEPTVGNVTLVHNPTYVWPDEYMLDTDKYAFLSASDPSHILSQSSEEGDYGILVSAGPITLDPGEERAISFAILGAESLSGLEECANAASMIYHGGVSDVPELPAGSFGPMYLLPNAPNPFRTSTEIRFSLENSGLIHLGIYDVRGRRIRTLVSEVLPSGPNTVLWDGTNDGGKRLIGGVYFLKLSTPNGQESRRLILLSK